jgi:hypothetical protein
LLREDIKAKRLKAMEKGADQYPKPKKVEARDIKYRWGDVIGITAKGGVCCLDCLTEIGLFRTNWRSAVPVLHPRPEQLGPILQLDDRFVYDQHVCPECAKSLTVDVRKVGDKPNCDFTLY